MTTTDDLSYRLARIDVKLDQLLARDDDHETRLRALEQRPDPATKLADQADDIAALEARMSAAERWRWLVTGAAASGGGIVGSLLAPLIGHTP